MLLYTVLTGKPQVSLFEVEGQVVPTQHHQGLVEELETELTVLRVD